MVTSCLYDKINIILQLSLKQLFYIQDDFKEWTDVLGLVLQNFVLEVIDKMSFGDFSGIIFL